MELLIWQHHLAWRLHMLISPTGLRPLMEELSNMQQNSEVDVNVLVNIYHTKLAAALNQNVLLEAKLQTLKNDFEKEKNELLEQLANLKSE